MADKEFKRKQKQEYFYNKRHRSRKLSELRIDDRVWVTDVRVYAKIVRKGSGPNSFIIHTDKGSVLCRNR